MSTPLAEKIRAIIASEGPIPVARYMMLCLAHPRYGYYMTRDPFGESGDFITAPEISQIFGELLGAWALATWQAMGEPPGLRLIEMGPGRGTLMSDALRLLARFPAFKAAASVHLVESSPFLSRIQRGTLAGCGFDTHWHSALQDVPAGPAIMIANELLDALPIRQFVSTGRGWCERMVGLRDGRLAFGLSPEPVSALLIPESLRAAEPGCMAEICPVAADMVAELGGRATLQPVAALFIDYGHATSACGETLQAIRRHHFVDPLSDAGEADITAHVDFMEIARLGRVNGLVPSHILTQRDLLFRLGLAERAEILAKANPQALTMLRAGVERLIDPSEKGMGALFKALVLASPQSTVPAFELEG